MSRCSCKLASAISVLRNIIFSKSLDGVTTATGAWTRATTAADLSAGVVANDQFSAGVEVRRLTLKKAREHRGKHPLRPSASGSFGDIEVSMDTLISSDRPAGRVVDFLSDESHDCNFRGGGGGGLGLGLGHRCSGSPLCRRDPFLGFR